MSSGRKNAPNQQLLRRFSMALFQGEKNSALECRRENCKTANKLGWEECEKLAK